VKWIGCTEKIFMASWQDAVRQATSTNEYEKTITEYGNTKGELWEIMEEINLWVPTGR
jgi:hypothetical protein